MGRKFIAFILAAIMASAFIGCGSSINDSNSKKSSTELTEENNSREESKELTEEEKVDDFEYLYKTIEENYPFLDVNKRLNNVDWLSNKDEYLQKVKDTKSYDEFVEVLNNILKDLNNGHTKMILGKESYTWYKESSNRSTGWEHDLGLKALNNKKAVERYENNKNIKKEETKENNEKLIVKETKLMI